MKKMAEVVKQWTKQEHEKNAMEQRKKRNGRVQTIGRQHQTVRQKRTNNT